MSPRHARRKRKLPTEPILVEIRDLAHDGRGVGHVVVMAGDDSTDAGQSTLIGKTVFVHGALPAERVQARLIARNRQFDEAVVTEVLTASPDRTAPQCPWYEQCGGCALQHMNHAAQVVWKHKRLVDNLERIGQVSPKRWAEPIVSEAWGYRRRARLSIRNVSGKGRVLVGFRERQGRFVADIGHCDILDEAFAHRLQSLSELIGQLSIPNAIPQIEVATGDVGAALILRHLEPLTGDDLIELKRWSDTHDMAIYLQSKGPDTVTRLTPENHEMAYQVTEDSLKLSFGPQQFIQVNASVNECLIARALDWLDVSPNDRVLDLFCGLGNFTLPLAKRAGQVIGVEGAADLVHQASVNARANGIDNAEFYVADLAVSPEGHPWLSQPFDGVLIDPPRSGAEEVLSVIAQSQARRVVYVSCNPATLARDAGLLVNAYGFELIEAGIADMFPHTAHVESIALFERAR